MSAVRASSQPMSGVRARCKVGLAVGPVAGARSAEMTTEDPSAAAESDDDHDSLLRRIAAAPSSKRTSARNVGGVYRRFD